MVAIILVVVIHADHWALQQSGADRAFWSAVDALARVSVPLFVVLTGLLLAYRRQDRLPFETFARRRLSRSLLPWVVWMPVYTVIGVLLTQEVASSPSGVASWWLQGGPHLWFLLLIPQLYLIFQLWPATARLRSIVALAILALALQTGLCVYRIAAPPGAPLRDFFLGYGYELAPFWIGYFAVGAALGAWLVRRPASGRRVWPFWIASAAAAVIFLTVDIPAAVGNPWAEGTGAYLRPLLPLYTVPLFLAVAFTGEAVLAARPRLRNAVGRLSLYSLGIYIVHEALTYAVGRPLAPLLQQHFPLSLLGIAIMVPATVALAYAAARLIAATPAAVTIGMAQEPLRRRVVDVRRRATYRAPSRAAGRPHEAR